MGASGRGRAGLKEVLLANRFQPADLALARWAPRSPSLVSFSPPISALPWIPYSDRVQQSGPLVEALSGSRLVPTSLCMHSDA